MLQPGDQQEGGLRKTAAPLTPGVSARRRALGELTNTPLLLSPSAVMTPGPENISTPPKIVPASPDTVTPTHNLKLLTELASKISGRREAAVPDRHCSSRMWTPIGTPVSPSTFPPLRRRRRPPTGTIRTA